MSHDVFKDLDGGRGSTWRIAHIPAAYEGRVQGSPLALIGALVFVVCILAAAMVNAGAAVKLGLLIAGIAGWFFSLLVVWYQARQERKQWVKLTAKCIDREWHCVRTSEGMTWTFRILCEFYLEGKKYQATPVYWTTFLTENMLKSFLEKAILSDSSCELYVNPKDPFQVELVGRDIKDFLVN